MSFYWEEARVCFLLWSSEASGHSLCSQSQITLLMTLPLRFILLIHSHSLKILILRLTLRILNCWHSGSISRLSSPPLTHFCLLLDPLELYDFWPYSRAPALYFYLYFLKNEAEFVSVTTRCQSPSGLLRVSLIHHLSLWSHGWFSVFYGILKIQGLVTFVINLIF